jgi:hypothetical protein
MRNRLRIAASVFFAVVAVVLCVLWVTSYWKWVAFFGELPDTNAFSVQSGGGSVAVYMMRADGSWRLGIYDARKVMAKMQHMPLPAFQYGIESGVTIVRAPHWFLLVVAGTAAAIPWLPWRFSLRTMLIATTLVAVVLGLICYTVR